MIYSTTAVQIHCGSETPEDSVRVLSALLQSRVIEAAIQFMEDYRLPRGVALVFDGQPEYAAEEAAHG